MRRLLLLAALSASLGTASLGTGCLRTGPRLPPPTRYDFGLPVQPVEAERPLPGVLAVADVAAPEWLAGEGILYRLAYENEARPATYGMSRWVAPPSELLSQRLLQRLSRLAAGGVVRDALGATADRRLRVELEEFSQLFESPGQSEALVRVRATLQDARGQLLGQEVFEERRPAGSDAAGAASGLREAADQVIDRIAAWVLSVPRTGS